ncbi:ABC transporter substrate-binding protein, partial [Noviherbaspirillum denitrificans]
GAARAAAELAAWGADVVIGHFASAAADAARHIYRDAGIPLLLPAATAGGLVEAGGNVFRLCDPDRRLAEALTRDLSVTHGVSTLVVACDGSLHGVALSAEIVQAAMRRGQHVERIASRVVECSVPADACVFVGQFDASVQFVQQQRAHGADTRLVLTDDAATPELGAALRGYPEPVLVYGFRPASSYPAAQDLVLEHTRRHCYTPGVYFLETYAALQIVGDYLKQDQVLPLAGALAAQEWDTVLGRVRFEGNEGGAARYGKWVLADGLLQYSQSLHTPPRGATPASIDSRTINKEQS